MADSLRLSAVTLHDVLEWKISICDLKNEQDEHVSWRMNVQVLTPYLREADMLYLEELQ